jgi:hypothetical protein
LSPTEAAVVYIPEDVEHDDGLYARLGVVHIERRGHKFLGVLRNAERVLRLARTGVVVVFAKRAHSALLPAEGITREWVGEETRRLVPIIQGLPLNARPVGPAAPFDESPTVAILDSWRAEMRQNNGRIPLRDDGGFAERFLEDRRRARYLNARDT